MKGKQNILVCVTQQKTCERLIKSGAEVRDARGGKLLVIHVTTTALQVLGNYSQPEALDYLFEISKTMNAEMTVIRSSEVIKTLVDFCGQNNVSTVVLGESLHASKENDMVDELKKSLGSLTEIKIVPV